MKDFTNQSFKYGQHFLFKKTKNSPKIIFQLVQVDYYTYALIDIITGNRWDSPIKYNKISFLSEIKFTFIENTLLSCGVKPFIFRPATRKEAINYLKEYDNNK